MTTPLYSRLIITSGNHEGKVYSLVGRSILVGRRVRTPGWDIRLTDETVSRRHARLEFIDQAWRVFDLQSANGTRVNRHPVPEAGSPLQTGDIVEFGEVRALFERYDGHLATTHTLKMRAGTG